MGGLNSITRTMSHSPQEQESLNFQRHIYFLDQLHTSLGTFQACLYQMKHLSICHACPLTPTRERERERKREKERERESV